MSKVSPLAVACSCSTSVGRVSPIAYGRWSLETAMDDIRAVMDAVGSESAVLWTGGTSTGIGVLFAATYPERCAGLVLFDPRVKGIRSPDYP